LNLEHRTLNFEVALRARILDLDDALAGQDLGEMERGDFRDLGPSLRYMCGRRAYRRFETELAAFPPSEVTLFGSGDFHHLTYALLRRQEQPFSLILFDQHPDWDAIWPWLACGSWVNAALTLPRLQKVVLIGAQRLDSRRWLLPPRSQQALVSGRLEVYPYSRPQALPRRRGRRAGVFQVNAGLEGRLDWRYVEEQGIRKIVERVLSRLPSERVYVSVDKDVLTAEWARTNWTPGRMQLGELCRALGQIRAHAEVVGADICGDWSAGEPANPLFRGISRMDHPVSGGPTREEFRMNAATNRTILHALGVEV
jgi:arginase family enzyme